MYLYYFEAEPESVIDKEYFFNTYVSNLVQKMQILYQISANVICFWTPRGRGELLEILLFYFMNQIPLLHITIQFSTYYEYPPFVVPLEGIKKHLNEEMIF